MSDIPKGKLVYVVRDRFSKEYIKHYKQKWRANGYVNRGNKKGLMLDWFEENIVELEKELSK